ncbi:DUF481 domain-containing protein [bacterium]|nr:DUF481 domain-containing protein [bacterium]
MVQVMKKIIALGCGCVLVMIVFLSAVSADVVSLKSGRQLGGAESFIYSRDGKVVIVDASGRSETLPFKNISSMKLDAPRKLEFKNGDTLHVENVALEEGMVRFNSDLLGQKAVPLEEVVAISGPAGKKIPEAPSRIAEKPPTPPKKWRGKSQFGYAMTSGREDSQNANLSAEAVRESRKTRLSLNAAARYGESKGEKSVDAQEVSGKFDLFLTDRVYLYWDLGLLKDSINLIDLRLSPGVGVGRKFITGDRFSLEGEAGATMIWERQVLIFGEKEEDSEWFGRVAARFKWKLGEWAEFSEELEILPGLSSGDEFRYRSVSQLTATVTKRLSLAAGFTVDYDNDPPAGVPRTSTNATTGFILNF